jgi:hypothetical protein
MLPPDIKPEKWFKVGEKRVTGYNFPVTDYLGTLLTYAF